MSMNLEYNISDKEAIMSKKHVVYFVGAALFIALLSGLGCATKKYVQGELVPVDEKIQGIETSIEENQKRIKEHDERLATLGELITQQQSELKSVDGKIEEVKKQAQGKLITKAVLQNNDAKFGFDSYELSPEAKSVLDRFVEKLIADNRGVYLEIQGHTDSTGPESYNLILGKERADAVRDYLYRQYHLPLYRMQVISYGPSAPIAENSTKEGRAQNRRVEILVYE
jgi:outer membrane protein OmpA-like peptidoglycan-associated protein